MALSVVRCYGELLSCTISEKINDPILRKYSSRRTDRQTGESGFIGRCPTNVELPIREKNLGNKRIIINHKMLLADAME